MGSAIIDAIKGGLGLMGDITKEFMNGFSSLFWDATANSNAGALTSFGVFALTMLGIGITFSVVKLVLNILRSNTGA